MSTGSEYFEGAPREYFSVLLAAWQQYYNWKRPDSAHNGKTPMEKYFEVSEKIPFTDEVQKFLHLIINEFNYQITVVI